MRRNAKLILRLISSILVCVVVFLAFSVSIIRLFGFEVYGVLTGSMEPEYPTGSLIYVKKIDTSSLEVGDTISFKLSENVIATHRIIELVPDEENSSIIRYRTKGDANSVADSSLVEVEDIIGKVVFCLPQMGYFLNYIQSPTGITTTIIVSILLVLLVFISEMLTSDSDNKLFRKVRGFFTGNTAPEPRGGNRRSQRGYEEEYYDSYAPARPRSSRYEDDYRPQRSRYEDDYRPQRSRSSQYDDDYRPRRTRSADYDYGYSSQQPACSSQRSRYEDDYAPRRSSGSSSGRTASTARSTASRSSSRYDDYESPRRSSAYGSSQGRSSSYGSAQGRSTRTGASQTTRVRRSDSDYR